MNPILPFEMVSPFRQIMSPQMPPRYLMRQIGMSWYQIMEEIYHDVALGTRILVRRDRVHSPLLNRIIIQDYITTREEHPLLQWMAGWTHQDVVYPEGEVTPYEFDIDAFHDRDMIMSNHRNNRNVNPLGEGHVLGEGERFPPLPDIRPLELPPFLAHLPRMSAEPNLPPLPALPALPAHPANPALPALHAFPHPNISFPPVPPALPFHLTSMSLLSFHNP